MKIGIYGGSFNPPHKAHEKISKLVIDKLGLDILLVVPLNIACHGKTNLISSELRYKMCEIVFSNIEKVKVSRIELDMEGISYTYKTLNEIIKKYGKDNEYYEIIGEDSASYFDEWKNYEEILEKSTVVVLKRRGYSNEINSSKIIDIENEYLDMSSSEIREKLKLDENCENYLEKNLLEFIKKEKIFK